MQLHVFSPCSVAGSKAKGNADLQPAKGALLLVKVALYWFQEETYIAWKIKFNVFSSFSVAGSKAKGDADLQPAKGAVLMDIEDENEDVEKPAKF